MMPGGSLGARLRRRGSGWGSLVLAFDRVDSTNLAATSLAKREAPHGTVVIAEAQSSGRGRWNRRWESAKGGLYLSAILRPGTAGSLSLLPLLSSVAAAEALQSELGIRVELRWPNDLFLRDRKLGGILCESSLTGGEVDHAVVGIGINLNQDREDFPSEIAGRAIGSLEVLGRSVDPLDLAAAFVAGLESWWDRREHSECLRRFESLSPASQGAPIRVVPRESESYEAVTRGLSATGGLKVELEDGTMRVLHSDEVHLLDA